MKRLEDMVFELFKACQSSNGVTQLHSFTMKLGYRIRTRFAPLLIDLYSKYGQLPLARKLFDETPHKTILLWNSIMNGYVRDEQYQESLSLFSELCRVENPDNYSVCIALKACTGLKSLDYGRIVASFVEKSDGVTKDLFVRSALVKMYSKCGEMGSALGVFKQYSERDGVLWTSMISGYETNGEPAMALQLFSQMASSNRSAIDSITLISVLSSCAQIFNIEDGRSVHGYMIRAGFDCSLRLLNALLSFYGKTGMVNAAANLFGKMEEKDVISWGSMVSCYAHNEYDEQALHLLDQMINRGVEPNDVVLISGLQACEATRNLEKGRELHEIATRKGLDLDIMISTSLIVMYMNCCAPNAAFEVFERMTVKDLVSCSALLSGCVSNGMMQRSIQVFRDMLVNDIRPRVIDIVKILTACAEMGILRQTICFHGFIIKTCRDTHNFIGASLIESYAKCGNLDDASAVFRGIKDRDVVIWSSMFAGYGFHGKVHEALELFGQMILHSSVKPNEVSFISILSACSHAGLVREGIEAFIMMVNDFELVPNSKHYAIVVDLLGRVGELDMAMEFVNKMRDPIGANVWGALLGACRVHQNREIGEFVGKKLLQADSEHAGYYVLLSNTFCVHGKWNEAAGVRNFVNEKDMKKLPGQSVVELRDEVCTIFANDRSHQYIDQIHGILHNLEGNSREDFGACSMNSLCS